MIPTIGRTVIVHGIGSNGALEHPAVITRSWGTQDTKNGPIAVNLTVFVDCALPEIHSSVMLFETEAEARAWCSGAPGAKAAFWPARA